VIYQPVLTSELK